MKKYGQYEYMCDLVMLFLEQSEKLSDQQKTNIDKNCCGEHGSEKVEVR